MMITISREQESEMPSFLNHKSARAWFKEKYGNRFVMQSAEWMDGEKIYFYHLVYNRDVYLREFEKIKNNDLVYNFDLINSYQPIEISDDGVVHVVY